MERQASSSPWLTALMPIAIDPKTGNELHLPNWGHWSWYSRDGSDLIDTDPNLSEVLLMYARVVDRRHNSRFKPKRNELFSDFQERIREEESQYLRKNRKWIEPRFVKDLETAVKKLSASDQSSHG